ncbi:MAG: DMT family transporter [Thermoplasmata archaeon]
MDARTKYIIIVLWSALIVAFEAVSIEGAINIAHLNVFIVSAVPPMVGGVILMLVDPKGSVSFTKSLGSKGWASMTVLGLLVALGVVFWFDSIHRIGASTESILGGGSSEVLFVVLLSIPLLKERLTRVEGVGSVFIVVGVFLVLYDPDITSLKFGLGETEAILSSLMMGASVVLTAALLRTYDLTPFSGLELVLTGTFVALFGVATDLIDWPDPKGFAILLALGGFPAAGLWTYNAGLPKIGASLTSVLFALTGIMTVGAQLLVLLFSPDAEIILPKSLALAVLGGAVAFAGVYLLKMAPNMKSRAADG